MRPLLVVALLSLAPTMATAQGANQDQGQPLDPETAPPNFDRYDIGGMKIGGSAFDPATGTWKLYTPDGRSAGTATYDPNGNAGRGNWRITSPDGRELGTFGPQP